MMIERAKSKQMPLENKTTTTNEEREETISIGNFLGLIGMPRPTQTRRLGSIGDYREAASGFLAWLGWTRVGGLEEEEKATVLMEDGDVLRPKDAGKINGQDYQSRMLT